MSVFFVFVSLQRHRNADSDFRKTKEIIMENGNFTNETEILRNDNNGYNGNNADDVYTAPMYGAPVYGAPAEPPAPPKKKKKGCLIAAIVVLVVGFIVGVLGVILAVIGIAIFGASGANDSTAEMTTAWYDDYDADYDNDYDYDWYTDDDYIDMIKDAKNSTYGITYGDAFDSFFTDPTWSYFEATTGEDVVEFEGGLLYNNEPVTALIQFILYVDEGTFEVYYLSLDDEDQDDLMLEALIEKVFEEY